MKKEALGLYVRKLFIVVSRLALTGSAEAAVVDGKIDETEREQARRNDDFKITDNLSSPNSGTHTQPLLLLVLRWPSSPIRRPGIRRAKPRPEGVIFPLPQDR